MRGMTVLDVGSATGFFAFEFERRGARVVSTELPSLRDLDRFPGQNVENSLRKIERMIFPDGLDLESMRRGDSERELYRCLLDGPFQFCRERLGSQVERCYSTIYDLTAENTGVRGRLRFGFRRRRSGAYALSAASAGGARAFVPRAARARPDAAGRPAGAARDDVCRRRRSGGRPYFLVAAQSILSACRCSRNWGSRRWRRWAGMRECCVPADIRSERVILRAGSNMP